MVVRNQLLDAAACVVATFPRRLPPRPTRVAKHCGPAAAPAANGGTVRLGAFTSHSTLYPGPSNSVVLHRRPPPPPPPPPPPTPTRSAAAEKVKDPPPPGPRVSM
jgi:hypothetical protein